MVSESLLRSARRGILTTVLREGRPGRLGRFDGTVTYVDNAGNIQRDRAWVRVSDNGVTSELVARCTKVGHYPNAPVRVADRDGIPTVIGVDEERALYFADGHFSDVGPHRWTHERLGNDPVYVTGLQMRPLLARATVPADMTVTVEQCFYRYNGVQKVWEQAASASLSSYVPTDPASGHFVILCLDRENNALAVVDGTGSTGDIYGQDIYFTVADVAAISIPDAYWPIAAIRFFTGQTSINARDIFMDLRYWIGEHLGPALPVSPGLCQGALTLTSGQAVTTGDVLAAGTVYFTPYQGNLLTLYVNSEWVTYEFTECSLSVPATTDTNYDVFVFRNPFTDVIELQATAWTNDTTRATALVLQDGVYVKSGATGLRYLGSFRTTAASGETQDAESGRFLWDLGGHSGRNALIEDSTTHTYETASNRAWNNDTDLRCEFLLGLSALVQIRVEASLNSNGTTVAAVGADIDGTTTLDIGTIQNGNAGIIQASVTQNEPLAPGYHFAQAMQLGDTGCDFQSVQVEALRLL